MLQTDILALERRQEFLEHELIEVPRHTEFDEILIADIKARVLFIREEIERLRSQECGSYH